MFRMAIAALLLLLAALPVLYFYHIEKRHGTAACMARGIAHFKATGSLPAPADTADRDRAAEDVVREQCARTTTAFSE
jgi:hypothetical protein